MPSLSALRPHALLTQTLNFALILSTAFMLWKTLSLLSDSKSPIVVVLSGSMEPAFQRGDLLFLWNRDGLLPSCWGCEMGLYDEAGAWAQGSLWEGWGVSELRSSKGVLGGTAGIEKKDVKVGEIVVYEVPGKDIPIVHRVVRRYPSTRDTRRLAKVGSKEPQGGIKLLTKGDNNAASDEELYARGQDLLDRDRDVIGSVVGFVPYVGYGTILLSEYPWLKSVMLGLMGLSVLLQRE